MLSQVLPHEIIVVNNEDYTQLQAEMGLKNSTEDGADAPQELDVHCHAP
jgi:hypothetical protein